MVRSSTLNAALSDSQNQSFKSMNNLLTLQENHVEEFFQYHGPEFMAALEKLMEDVVQRVVADMLGSLEFVLNPTTNHITLQEKCLSDYQKITEENIQLDIQQILASAVNSEVIHQRKMAKQQLERSMEYAKMIYNIVDNVGKGGEVSMPAWVQSKLTKSMDYLQSVYNYLDGKDGLDDKFQK